MKTVILLLILSFTNAYAGSPEQYEYIEAMGEARLNSENIRIKNDSEVAQLTNNAEGNKKQLFVLERESRHTSCEFVNAVRPAKKKIRRLIAVIFSASIVVTPEPNNSQDLNELQKTIDNASDDCSGLELKIKSRKKIAEIYEKQLELANKDLTASLAETERLDKLDADVYQESINDYPVDYKGLTEQLRSGAVVN